MKKVFGFIFDVNIYFFYFEKLFLLQFINYDPDSELAHNFHMQLLFQDKK